MYNAQDRLKVNKDNGLKEAEQHVARTEASSDGSLLLGFSGEQID